MTDDFDRREEICPDCQATESDRDARIIWAGQDPETGRMYSAVTYHHSTCPTYTVDKILMEDGVRRAKEQAEWAKEAFPAAYERLRAAAAGLDAGEAAPFAAALLELVGDKSDGSGRCSALDRWAEILDKHFPPAGEPPVRPDEEPT